MSRDERKLIADAYLQLAAAEQVAEQLRTRGNSLRARLQLAQAELDRCSQDSGLSALRLSPDLSELRLAPGASQTFIVSGGTGTPQAALSAGGDIGSLSRQLDGSFIFKAAAGAADGATATIAFSDGAQRLSRELRIEVTRSGVSKLPLSSLDLKSLGKALGIDKPVNDKELLPKLEACLRDKRFHNPPDGSALSVEDIKFVLQGSCRD